MKRLNLSLPIYLILVFASGLLLGVLGDRFYSCCHGAAPQQAGPEERRRQYMSEMRTKLQLTSAQESRINGILDTTREHFRELRKKVRPEVTAIQDQETRSIREVLDDRQRAAFDKLREEKEKEKQKQAGK